MMVIGCDSQDMLAEMTNETSVAMPKTRIHLYRIQVILLIQVEEHDVGFH